VYKPAGSVSFANLPALSADVIGNVYNVTDAFATTDDFVEGAGSEYPAGTNVVVVDAGGGTYKYDVLAGFVDLSDYAKSADVVAKEAGKSLMLDTDKAKLDGISEGANKTEASETNGYIKIDGVEKKVYDDGDVLKDADVATDDEVSAMLDDVFGASTT